MAPALLMEELPPLRERVIDCPAAIVHGWRDEVVPAEHSVRFAREYRASLHLLDSDHQLHDQLRLHQVLVRILPDRTRPAVRARFALGCCAMPGFL